jgi:large-conductance mechanosensitive channel
VYLVVIGWLYVVMMMAVAEATNTTGTVLGAMVTFLLYGLLPIVLVIYLMRTPQRRKERKAREAAENQAQQAAAAEPTQATSSEPDASGHAPGAAEPDSVAPVRKEV